MPYHSPVASGTRSSLDGALCLVDYPVWNLVDANQQAKYTLALYLTVHGNITVEMAMVTPVNVPEISILPSKVATGEPDKFLYAWKMKLHEESTLDSEDHGDDFDTVQEALSHAYTVFQDLVDRRRLYPANEQQEFKVTVITR